MPNLEFDEATHTYTLDGKKLISVTQLMQKHGLAPSYAGVSTEVLQKKAERGTLIHAEIEAYNKRKEVGFTDELAQYIEYVNNNKIDVLASETRVNNDLVAGTIDLILAVKNHPVIADIKTTYQLHEEAVSWQLSIYAYLYWNEIDKKNDLALKDYATMTGQAFHFDKDSVLHVVDIPLKPYEEVKKLMDCEKNGVIYNAAKFDIEPSKARLLAEVQSQYELADKAKKEAEAKLSEMKAELLRVMEENNVKSIDNDFVKITYVEPSTRTTIDSAALKKDHPAIAEQYSKTSQVKASIRITLKD